jgi:nucleotide-binding universal stress UspA family protein
MKVFVSYSRHDDAAVKSLVTDLGRAAVRPWLDQELGGGDEWWTAILDHIRKAQVFILAVSERSLGSELCRIQFRYAKGLGVPIVAIQVGEVVSYSIESILGTSSIDYRMPTPAGAFTLMGALLDGAAKRGDLPDPLPEPPVLPYEFLKTAGPQIHDPAELGAAAQADIFAELRDALRDAEAPSIVAVAREQLLALRNRPDIILSIANDIDAILHEDGMTRGPISQPMGPPAWPNPYFSSQ